MFHNGRTEIFNPPRPHQNSCRHPPGPRGLLPTPRPKPRPDPGGYYRHPAPTDRSETKNPQIRVLESKMFRSRGVIFKYFVCFQQKYFDPKNVFRIRFWSEKRFFWSDSDPKTAFRIRIWSEFFHWKTITFYLISEPYFGSDSDPKKVFRIRFWSEKRFSDQNLIRDSGVTKMQENHWFLKVFGVFHRTRASGTTKLDPEPATDPSHQGSTT